MPKIAIIPISSIGTVARLYSNARTAEGCIDWFETIARTTLSPGEEGVLATIWDDEGCARASIPLAKLGQYRLRSLTAPYTTLFEPALRDEKWARSLGLGAGTFLRGVLSIDAADLRDPGTREFFRGATTSCSAASYFHFLNRYQNISNFGDYWSMRPSRLRSTVKRKLMSAKARGDVGFRWAGTREEIAATVPIYLDVYAKSWKVPEPHPTFIPAMATALSKSGAIRIGILSLNSYPIAAQMWLVNSHNATIFKLAHDQNFKDLSPGSLLTHWMLEKLINQEKITEVDFGRGDDSYKRDWLESAQPRYGITIANPKSIVGLRTILGDIWPTKVASVARNYIRTHNPSDI